MSGKVSIVQTEWWCVELPPEWRASYEDDCVTIEDCDGVGALDFSALRKEQGDIALDELGEFCTELLNSGQTPETVEVGNSRGWYFEYDDEDGWWREWYLTVGPFMLYVTYNAALENRDMDAAAVNEILSTLVIAP